MAPPTNYFGVITVDDTKPADQQISVDPDPLETVPNAHIVFVVINKTAVKRKVSVPRDKFVKNAGPGNAPDTPIRFFGNFSEHVDPFDVGAIVLHVKDKDDFDPGNYYKYKYTIEVSGLPDKDPDIGINN
jgi:hypothetical protein